MNIKLYNHKYIFFCLSISLLGNEIFSRQKNFGLTRSGYLCNCMVNGQLPPRTTATHDGKISMSDDSHLFIFQSKKFVCL